MKDTEVDYEEREERKMGNWRFKGKGFLIGHQYNIWKWSSPIEDEYIYPSTRAITCV